MQFRGGGGAPKSQHHQSADPPEVKYHRKLGGSALCKALVLVAALAVAFFAVRFVFAGKNIHNTRAQRTGRSVRFPSIAKALNHFAKQDQSTARFLHGLLNQLERCADTNPWETVDMAPILGEDQQQLEQQQQLRPVVVIVPFRDGPLGKGATGRMNRTQQLMIFHEVMTQLVAPFGPFHMLVVEQSEDNRKFNTGKIKNVGFDIARKGIPEHTAWKVGSGGVDPQHQIYIFNDVDMVPDCDLVPWYRRFPTVPLHLGARGTRYTKQMRKFVAGKTFLGGIASFSHDVFVASNGYPNDYWGWGSEDDELLDRVHDVGINATLPDKGSVIDLERLMVKEKMSILGMEGAKFNSRKVARESRDNWQSNGVSNLNYTIVGSRKLSDICTIVTVEL